VPPLCPPLPSPLVGRRPADGAEPLHGSLPHFPMSGVSPRAEDHPDAHMQRRPPRIGTAAADDQAPTRNRANPVGVTPASAKTCFTVFLLSFANACSRSTFSLK
jgi:hypothetical protein